MEKKNSGVTGCAHGETVAGEALIFQGELLLAEAALEVLDVEGLVLDPEELPAGDGPLAGEAQGALLLVKVDLAVRGLVVHEEGEFLGKPVVARPARKAARVIRGTMNHGGVAVDSLGALLAGVAISMVGLLLEGDEP